MNSWFRPATIRLAITTIATLVAFAANSVLGRAALSRRDDDSLPIDPVSFTVIRLLAGAVCLWCIVQYSRRSDSQAGWTGSWASAAALFVYAITFSIAYLHLTAGTGALVLFGVVQVTMIGWGIYRGERPGRWTWLGFAMALGGLFVLVAPSLQTPSFTGAILMAVAGAAWAVYSLRGKGQDRPVEATAGNFIRSVPFALIAGCLASPWSEVTARGVMLAVASGAITSGLGYVLWYTALRELTATRAAVLQLAVPIIAAVGGVALLGEEVRPALLLASVLVLGGLGLSIGVKAAAHSSGTPSGN